MWYYKYNIFQNMEYSYDRQKEQEMFSYQPFGRAGGGAPLKDQAGNVYSMLSTIGQKIRSIKKNSNG